MRHLYIKSYTLITLSACGPAVSTVTELATSTAAGLTQTSVATTKSPEPTEVTDSLDTTQGSSHVGTDSGFMTTSITWLTDNPTTGSSTTSTTTTSSTFPDPTSDNPPQNECDVVVQDCPRGFKCDYFYSFDAGGFLTECTSLDVTPVLEGDTCTRTGDDYNGTDNCDRGLRCSLVNNLMTGVCLPFCYDTQGVLHCSDDKICKSFSASGPSFCAPWCNPIDNSCVNPELSCTLFRDFDDWATCLPKDDGPIGNYGELCGPTSCETGFWCMVGLVEECDDAAYCCSDLCDLNMPNTCTGDPARTCVPLQNINVPEALAHIGICAPL